MNLKKSLSKKILSLAIVGLFVFSLTSCQREGCPGMITQDNPAVEENFCSK